ncbi:MAG TPA: hypothetical protein DC033_07720 [Akkermansia muciniphila]|nr:hypothetical protein [Akkermansia muciniphila]
MTWNGPLAQHLPLFRRIPFPVSRPLMEIKPQDSAAEQFPCRNIRIHTAFHAECFPTFGLTPQSDMY